MWRKLDRVGVMAALLVAVLVILTIASFSLMVLRPDGAFPAKPTWLPF